MKEIADLTAKANKFLGTAELALGKGDYDSSVSRSYYAMFFMAEAALLGKGLRSSSHKGVISLFGEHFVKTGVLDEELGRSFRRAFDLRQKGDYSVEFPVTKEEAEICLQKAKGFVSELEAFLRTS